MSPIPFLKPGYYKSKRMNKMEPKARECFYLGPARNHPQESKRVLVDTGKVVITRNVTWAHAPPGRFLTAQSKPSEEGEGDESDHENREASSEGSVSASECEESESDESEEDVIQSSTAVPATSGRALPPTSSAESSQGGVSCDPGGMMPPGEGLVRAPVATKPDHRYAALRAGEIKRLAEHLSGPVSGVTPARRNAGRGVMINRAH